MDDLISRKQAIDAVKRNTFRLTFAEEQNCEGHVAWSAEAVYSDVMEGELLELPSAQLPDMNVGDMISKKQAVELIERMKPYHQDADDIAEMIDNMPSAQPESQWIPCSERLPKDGEEVFVYLFDRPSPYIAWVEDDHWYTEEFEVNREYEPLAWMPLPKPYGGKQE